MDCKTKPKKFVMSCSGTSQYSWEKCNAGLHPECFKGYHEKKKKNLYFRYGCFMDLWISQIIKQSIRLISCGSFSFRKTKIHLLECNF